jgi:hypothetical protein
VPKDLTRADYRASWAKMVEILNRMHKAGVPIVAGTDGVGVELVRELEIYVEAGFTPAEALAAAALSRPDSSTRTRTPVPSSKARSPTSCSSRAIPRSASPTCVRRAPSCSAASC